MGALRSLVDCIFPPPGRCTIERTEEGVSTQVYRVRREAEVFYLRVAEAPTAGLAPEAYVHELLRGRGVKVPAVIHVEPCDARLGRSVMVTTEIRGEPVGRRATDEGTKRVLMEAGRDLAVINSIPVAGFGWVKRDTATVNGLAADYATHRQWALDHFDEHLACLVGRVLTEAEAAAIRALIARYDGWLDVAQARLAHGDFDLSHIYQDGGQYSGIIDFGEIRGADPLYDLGHFHLHDGEKAPRPLLPWLLAGYGEAAPRPADAARRIDLAGVLIGVPALARALHRPPDAYQAHLTGALRRIVAALDG